MGIVDKLTGRAKQAAGDLADDASLRREGKQEERKGEAKEELGRRAGQGGREGRRGREPRAQDELTPSKASRGLSAGTMRPGALRLWRFE